jgi:hypothetical protein
MKGNIKTKNKGNIKTSQAEGMPLTPVGNGKPEHSITGADGKDRAIDQQAQLIDDRPYSAIFAQLYAAGDDRLHKCENANQVNHLLAVLKYGEGTEKQCTFLVNERAHQYTRKDGRWIKQSDEWIKANPYTPGTRTASTKGMLSDTELASVKAQIDALKAVNNPALASILDGLQGRVTAHDKAVQEAVLTGESARRRECASKALRAILAAGDRKGIDWKKEINVALGYLADHLGLDSQTVQVCVACMN